MAFQPIYAIRDRHRRGTLLPYKQGVDDGSTLTLDFTKGVLDPRLTFTRGSNATFINSSGLVQWADANLIAQSEAFTGSPWGSNGVTVASETITNPLGGSNAASLTVNASGGSRAVNAQVAVAQAFQYTFRVWVRAKDSTSVSIGFYFGSPINNFVTATASIVSGPGSGGGTGATYFTISNLSTTQWTQVQLVVAAMSASGNGQFYLYPGGVSNSVGNSIYAFGAQANIGATANAYYATSSAAYQAPRFDHDPTTGSPRGLLIEGSSENQIKNSNDIYTGSWGSSATVSATQDTTIPDPSGGTTTCKIVKSAGVQYVVRNQPIPTLTVPANSTVSLTASVWLRMDGAGQVSPSLGIYDAASASFGTRAGATVSNSAVTIDSGSTAAATYTFGSVTGWVRCSVSRSFTNATASPVTFTQLSIYIYPNQINTNAATIYAWGAQVESGVGPSSLIPTGASQGTRNADSAVMNDISSLSYSTTNGSIYWSGIINKQPTSYTTLIGFMEATDQPAYETFGNALNYFTAARGPTLGGGGANEVSRPYVLGSLIKYASSVNTLQDPIVAVNLNGSAGSNTKVGTGDLRVATRFVIGRQPSTTYGANYPSVTISSIKYWPTSKVAAELAVLTA